MSLLPACSATVGAGMGYAEIYLSLGCLLFGNKGEIGCRMREDCAGDNILRQSSSMLPCLKPYGYWKVIPGPLLSWLLKSFSFLVCALLWQALRDALHKEAAMMIRAREVNWVQDLLTLLFTCQIFRLSTLPAGNVSVLCSCALQTRYNPILPSAGEGFAPQGSSCSLFPSCCCCLVGACLAQGIESHAARPLHELPDSCTGTAHGLCTVHVREICVPEAPLSPPWNFNQPDVLLQVCPYPQWDPSSSCWFWTEEHETGCGVGPQGSSTLSSEARVEGELPGSSLPRKTSLVFQWPAYYVGQHQLREKKKPISKVGEIQHESSTQQFFLEKQGKFS